MNINTYFLFLSLLIDKPTDAEMQYSYPIKKTSSPYSYTVYKNKKVTGGINPNNFEIHTSYQNCVTVCYNIGWCKSIGIEVLNDTIFHCQFFSYIPTTFISDGAFFISTTLPSCSYSCNLSMNPCGKCDCNPSCSTNNRRQHVCNCTRVAGVAKSCQEHYDRGFNITGIFLININGILFQTVCIMSKVERQNPVIKQSCTLQPNLLLSGTTYHSLYPSYSVSYCVKWCANKKIYDSSVEAVLYWYSGCACANLVSSLNIFGHYYRDLYCRIERSSEDCQLLNDGIRYSSSSYYNVPYEPSACVSACQSHQTVYPTLNGYVASGIIADWQCNCLYGNRGYDNNRYGCSFETVLSTQTLPSIKGVWIPLMTRFASWDSNVWAKNFDAYENGFGLVNQQWIGLKKLYEITKAFVTDMRVDYTFKEDLTFSTMYYNINVGSKDDNYRFGYSSYSSRGSNEPDWFYANDMIFQKCKNWWTTTCDNNEMFPTSINYISYGKTENLVSIQFLLRTNGFK